VAWPDDGFDDRPDDRSGGAAAGRVAGSAFGTAPDARAATDAFLPGDTFGGGFGPSAAAAHRRADTPGFHGTAPHATYAAHAAGQTGDWSLPDLVATATATVDELVDAAEDTSVPSRRKPPSRPGRLIVLTSGTTGAPKGAYRANPPGLATAAVLISRIPLKAAETVLVATPLFHMWGLAALQIGMPLRNTLILRRRFDPEAALRAIADHGCEVVFAVPVVLQRIMELRPDLRAAFDTSTLRVVATSGAAIPSPLVTDFMDAFGDILYNFYGSTEVSWAAIADPEDLRTAPSTAGRPPLDSRLKVLETRGGEVVERGVTGRIFVENEMLFEGYTSGDTKEFRSGFMATGDVGHLDSSGRLFVHGREADMIVCGGEGLFPREVEDLLATVPEISEAAVVGVPDADAGQRFAAYVVVRPGAALNAAQVRGYVARYLPPSRVPRDVVFVDALPRNATGKVMVRDLPPSLAGD
jgi:acyl-CoA synthetase (AMP-forming)/AMP-acid ligase II